MNKETRSERDIWKDLEALCQSPGYVHVIAHFCFRDNVISFGEELHPDDFSGIKSSNRLIRTEISTLIGLMIKAPINFALQDSDILGKQIERTEVLLAELHSSMNSRLGFIKDIDAGTVKVELERPESYYKEPIFYSAESAYSFQYRDFFVERYTKDNPWLLKIKGFEIENVLEVINGLSKLVHSKLESTLSELKNLPPEQWTVLSAFNFTLEELSQQISLPIERIGRVISAFTLENIPCNNLFEGIGSFNITNARPIIPVSDNKFILFQYYSLVESAYESPIHWMREIDEKYYFSNGQTHRGAFTEEFCVNRLESVFDKEHIFQNLRFIDKKGVEQGEIDVLVVYADRAIVLQAKSKSLTLSARKGNDNALQQDFHGGIQKSYNQAWTCANHLLSDNYSIIDGSGKKLSIRKDFKEIFLFCVLSDHYPSLVFQVQEFLKYNKHDIIKPPYVMDVFFLDAMAEFLDSPLYFFDFIHKRMEYLEQIFVTQELTILSYHLRYNLWIDDDKIIHLDDSVSQDLDSAIIVRREGIPGSKTPDGLLTRLVNTSIGDLIEHIKRIEHDRFLDLGFFLLSLNEDTALKIGEAVQRMTDISKSDGQAHDMTMMVGKSGITIHCNYYSPKIMLQELQLHCVNRKYTQKSDKWFGIGKHALSDNPFDIVIIGDFPWQQSDEMDNITSRIKSNPTPPGDLDKVFTKSSMPLDT